MLLLGPPGVGKTHFAREVAQLLGTGHGLCLDEFSLTAGWVLSRRASQPVEGRTRQARSSRPWSTASMPTR